METRINLILVLDYINEAIEHAKKKIPNAYSNGEMKDGMMELLSH